jgi:hypothetical protein
MNDREQRLREFEALEREEDAKQAERDRIRRERMRDPKHQRAILAWARDLVEREKAGEDVTEEVEDLAQMLDLAVEAEAEDMADEANKTLVLLAMRLIALDLVDDDDEPIPQVVPVRATGEVFVGWQIRDRLYSYAGAGTGDDIIVKRQGADGYPEMATLDEAGLPGPWSNPVRDN